MTNLEILQKVVRKAIENGYDDINNLAYMISEYPDGVIENNIWDNCEWYEENVQIGVYNVIFSHKFAKAFWGEELVIYNYIPVGRKWEVRLQKMVLSDEPLKYLEGCL